MKNLSFGEMLSQALKEIKRHKKVGITATEIAIGEELGLSRDVINRWRYGRLPPSLEDKENLAAAIYARKCGNLDYDWFLNFLRLSHHPEFEHVCDKLFGRESNESSYSGIKYEENFQTSRKVKDFTGGVGRRYALIISNSDYHDQRLARLTTPAADAAGLRSVLEDPTICAFDEVTLLENQPSYQVRIALAQFFAQRKRDDLLLLYFSGHGLLDANNRFYLALQDSNSDYISATSISAQYVSEQMDNSRARRQIVILDCCHSGTFAAGSKAVATTRVGTGNAFDQNGYGRFILTATDHLQYAWEGDKLEGKYERSLFTHHLVEGLRTGAADLDGRGHITIENIYQYVHDKVRADGDETRRQTPMRWVDKQKGDLIIARTIATARPKPKIIRISQIRRFIDAHLELEDIFDICLDLSIDKESLGYELKDVSYKLLTLIEESGRWNDLLDILWDYYQEPFANIFGSRQEVKVMRKKQPHQSQPKAEVINPKPAIKQTAPSSIYGIEWIEIPAGEFWMGDNLSEYEEEKPGHQLNIDSFWISKTPITNAQFKVFVDETKRRKPKHWNRGLSTINDHPVVYVSWYDCLEYCQWLGEKIEAQVLLPSEAEWEKAARGSIDKRKWPWGNIFDPNKCNTKEANIGKTTPIDKYLEGASIYGVLDMAGNVLEWTRSLWGKNEDVASFGYPYDKNDGRENLQASDSIKRAVRGGVYTHQQNWSTCSSRWHNFPAGSGSGISFRVVVHSPSQP